MKILSPFFWLPAKILSHYVGKLAWANPGSKWQKAATAFFIRMYHINTDEIENPVSTYTSLGAFFIRHLKKGARPIGSSRVISPADGRLSSGGLASADGKAMAAKGRFYSVRELVGSQWDASLDALLGKQTDGVFYAVVYLAPYNYHRVHSPWDAQWVGTERIPGYLWPVNSYHVKLIDGLFTQNERVCMHFKIEGKSYYLVWVGATNVGCIEVHGINNPKPVNVHKGQELGYFGLGSTVIMIGPSQLANGFFLNHHKVKMGESLLATHE